MNTKTSVKYAIRHYRDVVFDDEFKSKSEALACLKEARETCPYSRFFALFRITTIEEQLKCKKKTQKPK